VLSAILKFAYCFSGLSINNLSLRPFHLPADCFQLQHRHVAVTTVLIRDVMDGLSFLLIARGTLECCTVRTAATATAT